MLPELTDEELATIESRASVATPGPWFVRWLDDESAANLVGVSTKPDTGRHERFPDFDASTMVAMTVVQNPLYCFIGDWREEKNAEFIAHAREDIERLIGEVRRLRAGDTSR
jgi:hypothetical protein